MRDGKKIVGLVALLALIVMLALPLAAIAQESSVTATTNGNVNLRSGPGVDYATIGKVPANASVPVLGRNADSKWILIQHQGQRGWIAAWLATINGDLNSVPVSSEIVGGPVRIKTLSTLNIRSGPGVNYGVLGTVPGGKELSPLARTASNSWLLIEYNGIRGWIARWLVTVNGNLNLLPVSDQSGNAPPTDPATPTTPTPPDGDGDLDPDGDGYTATMAYVNGAAAKIFKAGQTMGNRAHAFTKIGASDTAKVEYLRRFDDGEYDLDKYGYLQEIITYYKGSFNYVGQAMLEGMPAEAMLDPIWANPEYCNKGETPIECDYRIQKPSIAIIHLVTGPHDSGPYSKYYYNMETIVKFYIDHGVIPVLSTISHRPEGYSPEGPMNESVRLLAKQYNIPLWDLWVTTETMPDKGVDDSGHLTIPLDGKTTFFYEQYMDFGMVRRNLETLEVLHALLHQVVLLNGG